MESLGAAGHDQGGQEREKGGEALTAVEGVQSRPARATWAQVADAKGVRLHRLRPHSRVRVHFPLSVPVQRVLTGVFCPQNWHCARVHDPARSRV